MRVLLFLLIFNKCVGQSSSPVCLTDSCKTKFMTYTLNHGSFPMECIMINFKDNSGNKWSEMVYVVSIHNYYYYSIDSVNTKKYIDSVYSAVYNGEYIFKDTNIDPKFGGYPLNKKTFDQMKGMPFDKFLYKYFDREGNILNKYSNYTVEVMAVCFSNNITFYIDRYYYPAIHESIWSDLSKYYPRLKKLPKPAKPRYYED